MEKQLTDLAMMEDQELSNYLFSKRKDMEAPHNCIWTDEPHKAMTTDRWLNFIRHAQKCKHRATHSNVIRAVDVL